MLSVRRMASSRRLSTATPPTPIKAPLTMVVTPIISCLRRVRMASCRVKAALVLLAGE